MRSFVLIVLLLFGYGCASVNSDCLNDKDFKRFDSVLSNGITDDSAMNYYINDPGLLAPLRKKLCEHINGFNRITGLQL